MRKPAETSPELAAAISAHLSELAHYVRQAEDLVSGGVQPPMDKNHDLIKGLQRLDFVHQSLNDIATFLQSAYVAAGERFDPDRDLVLDQTRFLLSADDVVSSHASGALHLFE